MVRPTYFSMATPAGTVAEVSGGRRKTLKKLKRRNSNGSVSSFGSGTTTSTRSLLRRAFSLTSLKNLVRKKRSSNGGTTATASVSFEGEFDFEEDYPTQALLASDSLSFFLPEATTVSATSSGFEVQQQPSSDSAVTDTANTTSGSAEQQKDQTQKKSSQRPKTDKAVSAFLQLGDAEHEAGRYDEALDCWLQALSLSDNTEGDEASSNSSLLHQRALWNLTLLHLKLATARTLCVESLHDKAHHKREAQKYLHQLNLDHVPDAWLEEPCRATAIVLQQDTTKDVSGTALLEILMETEEWSTALRLSEFMSASAEEENLDKHNHLVRRVKYEAAFEQHNIPLLEHFLANEQDPFLQRRILFALVRAHVQQKEYEDALNYNAELLLLLQQKNDDDDNDHIQFSSELAKAYYDKAEIQSCTKNVSDAWDALHHGLGALSPSDKDLYVQLLQLKADILFREGILDECLKVHHQVLSHYQSSKDPPPEMAKLLYTMTRLSLKTRQFSKAVDFLRQELHVTKKALGRYNPEVSRILHDLARLYDEELGDYDMSLRYYKKAFKVESRLLEDVVAETETCRECSPEKDYCQKHSESYQNCYNMICESKKCLGRMHYKNGDFSAAVHASFAEDGSLLPI